MHLRVEREIKFLQILKHPHIIRLYEIINTPTDIILAIEYAKYELFDYILEKGRLSESESRRLFQQLIAAIEHCHSHSIAHRDLKPENILLDEDFNLKLGDFGLSNTLTDGDFLKTSCGSPNYAAPEVILGKYYAGPDVDVWSCGAILYVMLVGKLPFDDDYIPLLFQKIMDGIYTIPSFLSEDAKNLVTSMLKVNPLERITIPGIRQHPYFVQDLPGYLYPFLSFDAYGGESVIELVAQHLECTTTHVLTQLCKEGDNLVKEAYSYYIDNPNVTSWFLQSSRTLLSSHSNTSSSLFSPSAMTTATSACTSVSSSSSYFPFPSNNVSLPASSSITTTPPTPPFAPTQPNKELYDASIPSFITTPQLLAFSPRATLSVPSPYTLSKPTTSGPKMMGSAFSNLPNGSASSSSFFSSLPSSSSSSSSSSFVSTSASSQLLSSSTSVGISSSAFLPTEKWHLGLRSQSSPQDIMHTTYQVLKDVKMEWKIVGPYHLCARPQATSKLFHTTKSTELEIQLFKEDPDWYFVDFKLILSPLHLPTSSLLSSSSSTFSTTPVPPHSVSTSTFSSSSSSSSFSSSSSSIFSTNASSVSSTHELTMDTQKSHFCTVIHVFGFIEMVSELIQRLKHDFSTCDDPVSSITDPMHSPPRLLVSMD